MKYNDDLSKIQPGQKKFALQKIYEKKKKINGQYS